LGALQQGMEILSHDGGSMRLYKNAKFD